MVKARSMTRSKFVIPAIIIVVIAGLLAVQQRGCRQCFFRTLVLDEQVQETFVVDVPIKQMKRRLMLTDLTKSIVEKQGGSITSTEITKVLPTLQFVHIERRIVVTTHSEHYGNLLVPLNQVSVAKQQSIHTTTSLSHVTGAIESYESQLVVEAISETQCSVSISASVTIREYAPKSWEQDIRSKMKKALQTSVDVTRNEILSLCR
jgi:hypothetical protein